MVKKTGQRPVFRPHVIKLWSTPDSRRAVAIAARNCYTDLGLEELSENLTEAEIAKSVRAVLERRHTSCMRHAVFMFGVGNVSRSLSHQLVRHAVGHAYEQRSQHYRLEHGFDFVVPDTVRGEFGEEFAAAMEADQQLYDRLVAGGVPRDDARAVLPNACVTQLVWTANLEAVMNFCRARLCRVNTPEITSVAAQVRRLVLQEFPELQQFLGPTCWTTGVCYEGPKFSAQCNAPWKTPCVLWTPSFPAEITLVGVGKDRTKILGKDMTNVTP